MIHDWLDLLPIGDLGSLAKALAMRWSESLDAKHVVVSCLSSERTRLIAGDTAGQMRELDLPVPPEEWDGTAIGSLLGIGSDASPRALVPPDGPAMAGVHVVGGRRDRPAIAELTAGSIPLLEQGRIVDRLARESLAEKLEAMAEFAAGAGHEINNPLATINGRVQLLLKGETDPERRRSLELIGGQAYRVRDMIGDAMLFARPPQPTPTEVDAATVAREVCSKLDPEAERIEVETEPTLLWADPTQLAIVITELLRNALHAVGNEGRVRISVSPGEQREGVAPHGVITVVDDGPGLADLDRVHLFDPFYSGRQAGRGLGFGLSKSWRIVGLHGGRIDVESSPDATTVRVCWPGPSEGR